jgi:hypothetical protein
LGRRSHPAAFAALVVKAPVITGARVCGRSPSFPALTFYGSGEHLVGDDDDDGDDGDNDDDEEEEEEEEGMAEKGTEVEEGDTATFRPQGMLPMVSQMLPQQGLVPREDDGGGNACTSPWTTSCCGRWVRLISWCGSAAATSCGATCPTYDPGRSLCW